MGVEQTARTYRNVNLPLSWENRFAYLQFGKGRSLTSRVEKELMAALDRGDKPPILRAPRALPKVCLSFDQGLYSRIEQLSEEMNVNVTDVIYTLAELNAPRRIAA